MCSWLLFNLDPKILQQHLFVSGSDQSYHGEGKHYYILVSLVHSLKTLPWAFGNTVDSLNDEAAPSCTLYTVR